MKILNFKDLYPFEKFYGCQAVSENPNVPSEEHLDMVCSKYKLDKKNFYLTDNLQEPFVYWNQNLLVFTLNSFDSDYLKGLSLRRLQTDDLLLKNGAVSYFKGLSDVFKLFLLKGNLDKLTEDEVYDIVKYTFNSSILRKNKLPSSVLFKMSKSSKLQSDIEKYIKDDVINVYAGVPTGHINPNNNLYTLNLTDALKEATMDGVVGELYQHKLKKTDIAFIGHNNGVIYTNKKVCPKLSTQIDFESKKTEIISIYNKFKDSIQMYESRGIHGAQHVMHTLILGNMLIEEAQLSKDDRNIVMTSLLYHDIGRINDLVDETHGAMSYESYLERGMVPDSYIEYIITNHCIDDDVAFLNAKTFKDIDADRAVKLLTLVKDADGLDRFRLGDLNPAFLRTDYSKKYIKIAFFLNLN